jgi:hypothetical protein
MDEADSHLKLLPISILDLYKVFGSLAYSSSLTQSYPPYLAQIFGVRSHLWSQNDPFLSWLMLTATSNYSPVRGSTLI